MKFIYLIFVLFSMIFAVSCYGNTINVPSDYQKIQDAINVSVDGDTVLVAPGTYIENIDFKGKVIIVASNNGPEVTFIDGNQSGSVVTFINGETSDAILNGFTITNGNGTLVSYHGVPDTCGGGIYCDYASSPTILDNIIVDNIAGIYTSLYGAGGGIYCGNGSSAFISDNVIHNNFGCNGGGICCWASTVTINHNVIHNNVINYGGGGIYCGDVTDVMMIANNIMHDNYKLNAANGGAIYIYHSYVDHIITNNVIYNHDTMSGILLRYIENIVVSKNKIVGSNYSAINLLGCSDNTIEGNIIKNTNDGIKLETYDITLSEDNYIYHNSFINNNIDASEVDANYWYDQYPSGGNFWDDYTGQDLNNDGIGDSSYIYNGIQDDYPLLFIFNGLDADSHKLSAGSGGTINFSLFAGLDYPNRSYLLLGTLSGVSPGTILPGGLVLPINWDAFTSIIMSSLNGYVFHNFDANLDEFGIGAASLNLLPFSMSPCIMNYAYTLKNPWNFVSNPIAIEIVP